MCKRMFAFLALAFALLGIQCWATPKTTSSPAVAAILEPSSCTAGTEFAPPCIRNTFSPGNTTGVYDFGASGRLVVEFVTVLPPGFTLDVTLQQQTATPPFDTEKFRADTTCFHYPGNLCTQYNFTGNANGPNGVPQRNVNYQGRITVIDRYSSGDQPNHPLFLHAPEFNTTFIKNILVAYFRPMGDDTMDGVVPSLSAVAAFNEPLDENDTFCFVSPHSGQTFEIGQEIEVAFRLFPSGPCAGNTGEPIRDKTARLSLAKIVAGQPVFQRIRDHEDGNKFHFDHEDGVNVRELDTEGLTPGTYTITLISKMFPPQSVTINLIQEVDPD